MKEREENEPFSEVLSDHSLAEPISLKQEPSDVGGLLASDESLLDEELNSLGDERREGGTKVSSTRTIFTFP